MSDWKRFTVAVALALSLAIPAPALFAQDATDDATPVVETVEDAAPAEDAAAAGALAEAETPVVIPLFSLYNTNLVVWLGFIVFVGILLWAKVPKILGRLLDGRAETIRGELDEARTLREEAQELLATFERKQKEVAEQAERIVAQAKQEATLAADEAREEISRSVERRLAAAEDQIRGAEERAVREVRDQAVNVAVTAAHEIIAGKMTTAESNRLIDEAITTAGEKLH